MFQQEDVSVGAWFVFYFLSVIPVVNIVMWLVLLLGAQTNKSLKNLLVLQLILAVVAIAFTILFWGVLFSSVGSV